MSHQPNLKETITESLDLNLHNHKKRRVVEQNLTQYESYVKKPKINLLQQEIRFNVDSTTEPNTQYIVGIQNQNDGIKLECNCGDTWSIHPRRNNCKHIGAVVSNILKQYIVNHNANTDEMDDILNKLAKSLHF